MPAVLPMLVDVTTTTVFASSSATPTLSIERKSSSVPVAAVAGGVTAGALLAVAIVIGWIVWGRSIKRQKAKQQREADELRITKDNTMRNASTFSKPRHYSYRPLFWPPSDTQVRFAAPGGSEKNTLAASPTPKTPSRPKPLTPRVSLVPKTSTITPSTVTEPVLASQSRTIVRPARVTTQAPTPDPEYPALTEDGRSQSSIFALVAALGASTHRLSSASSWSRLTGNRVSQATSGSSYSQPSNRSTVSVGRAY
ncbi:hypothetical protein DFJ43DRAFT_1220478 [Lentinula guzmanii]|uniref:Transmembrane protein n=2 Tax=Lentinula TaxID=5352 RepID=A0AA38N4V0_9AGAR|nr:hypothetical protein DFJ43DRAFT_1220478 [Lentinula guzmanii]KAJ3788794.1 hypothetical protein GGU10DRAFT_345388 [Lentinula aff. detonsa]